MTRTARARRWLRLHLTGNRQRYRNWLNRRAWSRGRTPLPERVARPLSSLPVYRNRVNPATGRPRRDDRQIGRVKDASLARMAPQRRAGRDVGNALSDIGPRRRMVEIEGPDGRLLARWEGWSLTARGAVANADRLRSDRQPRRPAGARGRSR